MDNLQNSCYTKRKPFEELTLADDFLFCKVMQDESLCKELLEIILHVKIVVVKHFCNTLFENSPGISSFKWCFPIIVGMRTDMIVPYVHISV